MAEVTKSPRRRLWSLLTRPVQDDRRSYSVVDPPPLSPGNGRDNEIAPQAAVASKGQHRVAGSLSYGSSFSARKAWV
jgi:hypothetical protein